jgi:hypothetical protein
LSQPAHPRPGRPAARRRLLRAAAGSAAIMTLAVLILGGGGKGQTQVPATLDDFFLPGTQPFDFVNDPPDPLLTAGEECRFCHGNYSSDHAPFDTWKSSIMAQAARDPLFHAALAIAEQDVAFSGDMCLRCHAPRAWLEGRSTPTDGSALAGFDFEGVTCIACHRMIDPIYEEGVSPPDDLAELAAVEKLAGVPTELHGGEFIIDRRDRRRGPFDLGDDFFLHDWRQSPYHREAMLCSSCHDVNNPAYERRGESVPSPDDTYALGTLGAPHPTLGKYDMFPLERTFSEWTQSAFAAGPIDMGGRFGGNNPLVSTCQDCHMPDVTGTGCNPFMTDVVREDLPRHAFSGAANWILDAILDLDQSLLLYDQDGASGLTPKEVAEAKARNEDMLRRAADLEARVEVGDPPHLIARVVNQAGHKLPSGYPEGRRIWLNVRLLDTEGQQVQEYGAYDDDTAALDAATTKVYEARLGIDDAVAALSGLPAGPSFRMALANVWLKDNRIPPRGFTNAGLAAVQAAPVAAAYADGQHWDDTEFALSCETVRAEVRLHYQTASREYIEFLRDANVTNDRGQIAYDLWEAHGRGAPVEMALVLMDLDCNRNGVLDACDIAGGEAADVNADAVPDFCVVASDPPGGAIDARQPHAIDALKPRAGWDSLTLTFNGPQPAITPEDFQVTSTSGKPRAVTAVQLDAGGTVATLTLSAPIMPGAWTDITFVPSSHTVRLGFLPADVNADGTSSPLDILALIDALNGLTAAPPWSTDINRSAAAEPGDILRLIDLLNGAGEFEPWNGRSLP